jgi:hypothetical protein
MGSMDQGQRWPPLVYIVLGFICLGVWLAGTAIQVQTSQAWIAGRELGSYLPTFATFAQIVQFFSGQLPSDLIVPFAFSWGVQGALLVASAGVEFPRRPAWRYWSACILIVALLAVNSAGDWIYSTRYGFWGQMGFTTVVLFMTFFAGFLAIRCFTLASSQMKVAHA